MPSRSGVNDESDPEKEYWSVKRILMESRGRYKVDWEGTDPATGKRWPPSWVSRADCTPDLIETWESEKNQKQLKRRRSKGRLPKSPIISAASKKRRRPSSPDRADYSSDAEKLIVRKRSNKVQQQKLREAYSNSPSKPSSTKSKQQRRSPSVELGTPIKTFGARTPPDPSRLTATSKRNSISTSPHVRRSWNKMDSKKSVSERHSGQRIGWRHSSESGSESDEDGVEDIIVASPRKKRKLNSDHDISPGHTGTVTSQKMKPNVSIKGKRKQVESKEDDAEGSESSEEESQGVTKSSKVTQYRSNGKRPSSSKQHDKHEVEQESDSSSDEDEVQASNTKRAPSKSIPGPVKVKRQMAVAGDRLDRSKRSGKSSGISSNGQVRKHSTFGPASIQRRRSQASMTERSVPKPSGRRQREITPPFTLVSDDEVGSSAKVEGSSSSSSNGSGPRDFQKRERSAEDDEDSDARGAKDHRTEVNDVKPSSLVDGDSIDVTPIYKPSKTRKNNLRIDDSTQESFREAVPPHPRDRRSPLSLPRDIVGNEDVSRDGGYNAVEADAGIEMEEQDGMIDDTSGLNPQLADAPNGGRIDESSEARLKVDDRDSQDGNMSKGTIIPDSQPSQQQSHSQLSQRTQSMPYGNSILATDSPQPRQYPRSLSPTHQGGIAGKNVEVITPLDGSKRSGPEGDFQRNGQVVKKRKPPFPSSSQKGLSPTALLRNIASSSSPSSSKILGPVPEISPSKFRPYIHLHATQKTDDSRFINDTISQIESFDSPMSKHRPGIPSSGQAELLAEIEEAEDEESDRTGAKVRERNWESVGYKGPSTDDQERKVARRPLAEILSVVLASAAPVEDPEMDVDSQEYVPTSSNQDMLEPEEPESRNMNGAPDASWPDDSSFRDESVIGVDLAQVEGLIQTTEEPPFNEHQEIIEALNAVHSTELSKLRETISGLEKRADESEQNLLLSSEKVKSLMIDFDYLKRLKDSIEVDLDNMKDLYRSAAARSADLEDDNSKLRKEIAKLGGQVHFSAKQVRLSFEAEIGVYKQKLKVNDAQVKFYLEQARRTGIKLQHGTNDEPELKGDEVRRRAAEWSLLSKEVTKLRKVVEEAEGKEELLRILLGEAEERGNRGFAVTRDLRRNKQQLEIDLEAMRQESDKWKEIARQHEEVWTCEWINMCTQQHCGAEFANLEIARAHVQNHHAVEHSLKPNGDLT